MAATASSAVIFYEQLLTEFKRDEQVAMAELDNLTKKRAGGQANMNDAVASTEQIRKWEDHMWPTDKLCDELKTNSKNGLSAAQASAVFAKEGKNALTEKKAMPWYCVFLGEMTGFFSLLLWFGAFLCFIGYGIQTKQNPELDDKSNLYLGIVLATVTFITGCFSYQQTSKAASLMDEFNNFIPRTATVIRDGKTQSIPAENLVIGDLVIIKGGDNVPADTILLQTTEMKVNNSSLTGESEELLRLPDKRTPNVFESENVCFFGTQCTTGQGTGIVFRTGDNTVIGLIANLSQTAESAETPLSIEIERFIKIISAVALTLGITFLIFGFIYGYDPITNLVFAIGIIVANVPEGLLATVTVSLALTAKRMHKKMVLVKNLESVETLGSTSCICSDKTGTLTQNRMTVSHMFLDAKVIDASVNWQIYKKSYAREMDKDEAQRNMKKVTEPSYDIHDTSFKEILKSIALNTTAFFTPSFGDDDICARVCKQHKANNEEFTKNPELKHSAEWADKFKEAEEFLLEKDDKLSYLKKNVKGDASETGLIKFAEPILLASLEGLDFGGIAGYREKFPVVKVTNDENKDGYEAVIPFSSDIKFNLLIRDLNKECLNPTRKEDNVAVFLKGAPERVLSRCTKILCEGQEIDFTDDLRADVNTANNKFGGMGERVLAFARKELDPETYVKGQYQFDTKQWKMWKDIKEFSSDISGWFPMWGLTLVGVVSLNDPPRPKVDISVEKCQAAGIKVIMVTGDQPPTAAAIAAKVNIITKPELEYAYLKEHGINENGEKMTDDEAMEAAQAIVIHGDTLAQVHASEDALAETEIEKGRKIQDWIRKPEVVFARTTPSQKLLIVDACQKLGHIVAVTGDGVNDSPAIKKADIGIAMGSGSDVAQNAADMLLLDDNFNSIVGGVEEGRLIFDNLKKSIAYTLSSNIPEIAPFLFFILFQVPLPLSTVLILCIDLGTDMVPAISFAYENPELDIMERHPRNSKRDHLVNSKLISFAYLQIGMIQASAGFYTYFYVLNDYGLAPWATWFLALEYGYVPQATDVYNPGTFGNGNTNYQNPKYRDQFDWDTVNMNQVDFRLFYTGRPDTDFSRCRWNEGDGSPKFYWHSHVNETQICYTSEALRYAQAAYLVSIVCVQWSDLMICKTRNLSISQQLMINNRANFGLFFETSLVAILCYVPFLNVPLGTRQIAIPHFAVPSFSFFVIIMTYDELRKIFLRDGTKVSKFDKRAKYDGWVVRNTFY